MGQSQSTAITYSVPVSDTPDSGETAVYRNSKCPSKLREGIERLPFIKNLQDLHQYAGEAHANSKCMATRQIRPDGSVGDYQWKTFGEIYAQAKQAGSAMLNLNLAPEVVAEGNPTCRFVALYAKNREEWAVIDVGSCLYGITTLALYDTLGAESMDFIFGQTGVETTFCSGENLDKLIKARQENRLPTLKTVICFDNISEDQRKTAEGIQVKLLPWKEFLSHGEKILEYPKISPDTIFTLSYTSGTMALPKAVMITHNNLVSFIGASEDVEGLEMSSLGPGDTHISYLPLAHILERAFFHAVLFRGANLGFSEPFKLRDDLPALQPSFLLSVPRIYNKLYDGIKAKMAEVPPGLKKTIADKAVEVKMHNLHNKGQYTHPIFDPIVFGRAKALTGGKIKFYMSGSAPISSEVTDFLKIAFCEPLIEGYGQTETCAAAFGQSPRDASSGNVGGPLTCLEFKLVDVPDMKYTSKDKGPNGESMPRGEICMRGSSIFPGYYKDTKMTKETIDEQGWHHSGDIGVILPNGALKILDRKKNIFKLAQGEYVAPEKVEQIYLTNKYVAEIFIYGDSFRTFCVAIIVPEEKQLMKLAEDNGITGKSFEELCKDPVVNKLLLEDLNKTGKAAKLFGFELPKAIYLEHRLFANNDLTTPSLKVKRTPAREFYQFAIDQMYKDTKDN